MVALSRYYVLKAVNMNKRQLTKFFKDQGLNKEQVSYAHVLKSMYGSTPLEKIIEMAKDYQPLKAV